MANRHRPFEGVSGQIFRWLLDNGPAQAATIANALNIRHEHAIMTMRKHDGLFVRLDKAATGSRMAWVWSVWED